MNHPQLLIKENLCCHLQDYKIEILTHLGQFLDIHYYQVIIKDRPSPGLLRIGSPEGGLQRELKLREHLGDHKMISPLLLNLTLESVDFGEIPPYPPLIRGEQENTGILGGEEETQMQRSSYLEEVDLSVIDPPLPPRNLGGEEEETQMQRSSYLEEEYYPEIEPYSSTEKLLLLTEIPPQTETLEAWLTQQHTLDECLLIASQVCQFFRFVYQYQFCFINLFPQYVKIGTPLQFYDLTHAYPQGQQLESGFLGEYYPPELAYCHPIGEQMSTYVVASLLYQGIHQQLPPQNSENLELPIKKIPKIYQLLQIALTPLRENRFSLSQFLNQLVTTRKTLTIPHLNWQVAYNTTVGLSTSRLENEDSYGIIQSHSNESDSVMVAVIADGMGGLAQGEIASQLAVKTVRKAAIPADLSTPARRSDWLNSLVEIANQSISKTLYEGGTTISIVVAVKRELNIAHVGDSRIYLMRNNLICQLSEDHSMVAMLLASGQITYEESLHHSDRNILLKSLGNKARLSEGYVQELNRFGGDLSLILEDEDIIILCSDGVWE